MKFESYFLILGADPFGRVSQNTEVHQLPGGNGEQVFAASQVQDSLLG